MMRFYKLRDISNYDIYVNPKHIESYLYHNKDVEYVEIRFTSGEYAEVYLSDFENMMILEGVDEYWNTQHTIESL